MLMGSGWEDRSDVLHLAHWSRRCTVLGPGMRAVIWVQGCPLRCPGCVVPEMQPFAGGTEAPVEELAEELAALPGIEGVTFSGGEPMMQAAALAALIDHVQARRALTWMSYTGFTLEQLQAAGTPAQHGLLARLDVLVDGPYVRERHTDLLWRGSDNQRVHFLSDRYRPLARRLSERGRWIEFELDEEGGLHWMGIPPPGFRERFEQALAARGIELGQREMV